MTKLPSRKIILPELPIAFFSFLINFAWEVLQTPFFIDISGKINTVIWFRLHCTFGDVGITLAGFWLVAIVSRNRLWILDPSRVNLLLFFLFGIVYTLFSEIKNVSWKQLWFYSELMPTLPGINVGIIPLLQWLVLPPLLIIIVRRHLS